MNYLGLLIKPSSSNCNLICRYCFYHSLAEKNRKEFSYGFMKRDTIESIVSKAFQEAEKSVSFAFQGGEPTLSGLGYFESFIEIVENHNKKNIPVNYSIQTNGIKIDREWASFLAKHKFLVGLSLDGYKDLHDVNRIYANGKGSFNSVMKAADIMKLQNVDFNILTVVSSSVARHIEKIYKFYKNHGFKYLQFIPCLEPLDQDEIKNDYSLSPKRYGDFLLRLFALYYNDFIRNDYVSIRYFDNLVGMLMGYMPESCDMNGICSVQYVIEADGKVFPCDFYCTDEYLLGNIYDKSYSELLSSDIASNFIESSKNKTDKCIKCEFYPLCRGGCRRTRGSMNEQFFCESYTYFYKNALPRLQEMARIQSQKGTAYNA